MKTKTFILALMLIMGTGTTFAQHHCEKKHEAEKKAECCEKNNVALENIMTRTSIRKFTERKVEACKIEKMLRAAMAAPTAMNRQPWHFIVVDDHAVLDSLAGRGHRGDMLRSAPLAIVVCGDFSKAGEGQGKEYWVQDASVATENLLLAAHALGLGAVWTSAWPNQQKCAGIQWALGLPETIMPLNVTVIGYPAEQPAPKDKWKPENVSYNQYGKSK